MNTITKDKRIAVISALVEGNSIRSTVRMTGVSKGAVLRLLEWIGEACLDFQDKAFNNLNLRRIQCDEIWSFCYSKQKNVPEEMQGKAGIGDVWTWTAIDAETKLVPSWLIGGRDADSADRFMKDLARRLANRVQLTTDGFKCYLNAVEGAFGIDVDYSMLVKLYGPAPGEPIRYSPGKCIGTKHDPVVGWPDPEHISTSYVERQNLTMRMKMRRFTRLTNAFSKKVENTAHAIALHFMHYNFCRVHQTLKTTPAIKAGVASHIWTLAEVVDLLDQKTK